MLVQLTRASVQLTLMFVLLLLMFVQLTLFLVLLILVLMHFISCVSAINSCVSATNPCVSAAYPCVSATNSCVSVTISCLSSTNSCISATNSFVNATNSCVSATNSCVSVTISCLSSTNSCVSAANYCIMQHCCSIPTAVLGLAFVPLGTDGWSIPAIRFQLNIFTGPGYVGAVLGLLNIIVIALFFRECKLVSKEAKRKLKEEAAMKKKEDKLRKKKMTEYGLLGFPSKKTLKHFDVIGAVAGMIIFFVIISGFSAFEVLVVVVLQVNLYITSFPPHALCADLSSPSWHSPVRVFFISVSLPLKFYSLFWPVLLHSSALLCLNLLPIFCFYFDPNSLLLSMCRLISPLTMDEFAWTQSEAVLYNNLFFAGLSVLTIITVFSVKYITKRSVQNHIKYVKS